MLGSAIAEMIRWRSVRLVNLDRGAARCAATVRVPSKRVTSRPSSCGEQIALVGRDQLDQVLVERLALGERLAFAHGLLGQRAVAAALACDAAQIGGRIVLHLLLHDGVHLAAHQHRMRRAGIGARRHGRHVAGFQNEEAGGCRARAARRDVSNHRHGRGDDLLDGLAHGVHQAAGSVQADQNERGMFLLGLRDGALTISAVTGWTMPSTSTAITRGAAQRAARSRSATPAGRRIAKYIAPANTVYLPASDCRRHVVRIMTAQACVMQLIETFDATVLVDSW